MNWVWGIIAFLVIFGAFILGAEAIISMALAIGGIIIPLIILLLIFQLVDATIGWGLVIGVMIILCICEIFFW